MNNFIIKKYLDKDVKSNYFKWDAKVREQFSNLLFEIEMISMQTGKAIDSRIDHSKDQLHKLKFGFYVPGEKTPPGGWIFLVETTESGFLLSVRNGKKPKFDFVNMGFPILDKGERHIVFASTLEEFKGLHDYTKVVSDVFLPWLKISIEQQYFKLHVRYPFCPVGIDNLQNLEVQS